MGFADSKSYISCLGILTTISHLTIGAVASVSIIFGHLFSGSIHYRQHVMLTGAGYVILMGEGILSLSRHNGWTLNYYAKNIVHRVMGVIGSALVVAGSLIRIEGYTGQTFSTAHGILGWFAMILTCITVIGGVISIYIEQRRVSRSLHALVGILTFIVGMIALCFGFDKSQFRFMFSNTTAATMIALTVISTITISFPVLVNTYRKLSRGGGGSKAPTKEGL